MAPPEIKNTQIRTGTDIGDVIEVVDVGGSTPGLPGVDGSQILNLDTSQITSGTFDDARIAETNVTQHEDALAIDLPQLTQSGATDGQVLAWNNSASEWQPTDDTDTRTGVSDNGSSIVNSVSDINFNSHLNVTDDTDGTVTIDVPVTGDDTNVVTGTAGTSGNVLEWDAAGNAIDSSQPSSDIGRDVQSWSLISSATTAAHSDKLLADTSGGAFTVTLPASPSTGDFVLIADPITSWNTNNLTVDGNGNNVEGATTFVATTDDGAFHTIYNGTQWIIRFGP